MKLSLYIISALVPFSVAVAEITVSGENIEINKDCIRIDSNNVKIRSDDCDEQNKVNKNNDNRSVQGDHNPGQGHDKDKKKDKGK
ncbi:CG2 omega domain protein [Photobacterium salinisoli]|uniref:CG2 omega domain protein n=1 Tax=Photobacterium salinisoli TaxID=1616783 RepID=UPI000EA0237B|nr:CG2 omega domain protein [Photobacterium salinisoli]